MPWSILHRYVLWELLRVFVMALTAITGILVMAGIVAQAAQEGVSPGQILRLIPLMIPATMPFVVPATTLFAVSVVYGRLSADSEITAIKAAGIPVNYVIWPVLIASAGVSVGVYFLYRDFIPRSLHQFRDAALKNVEDLIYARLRRDGCFNEPKVNYSIYVTQVQGHRLLRATFKKRDVYGRDELIAQAREAELHVDMAEGVVNVHMLHGDMSKNHGENTFSFEREVIKMPLPSLGSRQIRGREMTNKQIAERRLELEGQIAELRQAIAQTVLPKEAKPQKTQNGKKSAHGDANKKEKKKDTPDRKKDNADAKPATSNPDDPEAMVARLPPATRLQFAVHEVMELDTEVATRPALSFGSFFFAMIGCPVAIWFHRRDYLSSFVTCFLPIVVVYYPLVMFGINLGKEGRFDPNVGMWVSNAVLGVAGSVLFFRLMRR